MAISHLFNGPETDPQLSFWRPSRKPSGESWGDSRGTYKPILGAKPSIFPYIFPRIPPRFPTRPPGSPPKLKCGAILGQFLLTKQMRNCHMAVSHQLQLGYCGRREEAFFFDFLVSCCRLVYPLCLPSDVPQPAISICSNRCETAIWLCGRM